jgi:hypothetical protein
MTPSAPTTRLNPLRGFRPANFADREPARLTVPDGTVIPFPSTQAAHAQHILMVEFTSPDGRTWQAVGGGDTLADAIAFAQDSCPTDATWQPIRLNDLYGD